MYEWQLAVIPRKCALCRRVVWMEMLWCYYLGSFPFGGGSMGWYRVCSQCAKP